MPNIGQLPKHPHTRTDLTPNEREMLGVGANLAFLPPTREGGLREREKDMTTDTPREPAYGAQMATYFRLPQGPSLVIQPTTKPAIAITRLVSDVGLPERTESIPAEKAFVVSVHLTPASVQGCDIWVDDHHSSIAHWPAGGVGIYDLESNPRTRNRGPVDWVHFHVPRATFDAFTDDSEIPQIDTLEVMHGAVDPVLHQMTQLILTSLSTPRKFSTLFLDHFRLLFCAHVVQEYAPSVEATNRPRGGLAPWQKRRVIDLLRDHLDGSLRLPTLAQQCGLSVSHFARAFRQSFGTPPHHYLVLRRIERAKVFLSGSSYTLCEVAQKAGFSDQASFGRTFKIIVGTTPGQWRRRRSSSRQGMPS
jgi:AraC family transcriptional regulator